MELKKYFYKSIYRSNLLYGGEYYSDINTEYEPGRDSKNNKKLLLYWYMNLLVAAITDYFLRMSHFEFFFHQKKKLSKTAGNLAY